MFKANEQLSSLTNTKATGDEDLPSPEGSDDEGSQNLRDSFVTPGFEKLDYRNFEHFGENVEDFESRREEEEREWQAGRRTSMRNSEVMDAVSNRKSKRDSGVAKKLNFEGKIEENDTEENDAHLSRWEKRHSLNRVDKLPPEERRKHVSSELKSQPSGEKSEDDLLEDTPSRASLVSVESLHIRHLGPKAVYMKMQDFERQKKERGYTEVLKMRDRLQNDIEDENGDDFNGKIDKKRPSSGVQFGNVNAKLEMFGGRADYARKQIQLHERDKGLEHPGSPIKTSLFVDEFTFDDLPSSPEKDETASEELTAAVKEEVDGSTEKSPSHGKVKRRKGSLSSRASMTNFETIREAEENGDGETYFHKTKPTVTNQIEDESKEAVSPLPKLPSNLYRRLSQERLRLDGLLPSESSKAEEKEESLRRNSQSQGASKLTKAISIPESAEAPRKLHISFDEINLRESSGPHMEHKRKGRSQNRPVSAPPLPHGVVKQLGREHNILAKEVLEAERLVAALLSPPQLTGSTLQLDLTRGSLKTWKQEVNDYTHETLI